ncbi:WhiB family transcriptional regulator [Streptomyces phaeochromogenes]
MSHDNRLSWALRAACNGYDLDVFFTESKNGMKRAKQICAGCPVRRQCLAEALRAENDSRFGVSGGLTAAERSRLVKSRAEPAKPEPEPVTRSGRPAAKCGTRSGYTRHTREKTEICAPCRQANTDAYNRLVRTGTTKALM